MNHYEHQHTYPGSRGKGTFRLDITWWTSILIAPNSPFLFSILFYSIEHGIIRKRQNFFPELCLYYSFPTRWFYSMYVCLNKVGKIWKKLFTKMKTYRWLFNTWQNYEEIYILDDWFQNLISFGIFLDNSNLD